MTQTRHFLSRLSKNCFWFCIPNQSTAKYTLEIRRENRLSCQALLGMNAHCFNGNKTESGNLYSQCCMWLPTLPFVLSSHTSYPKEPKFSRMISHHLEGGNTCKVLQIKYQELVSQFKISKIYSPPTKQSKALGINILPTSTFNLEHIHLYPHTEVPLTLLNRRVKEFG